MSYLHFRFGDVPVYRNPIFVKYFGEKNTEFQHTFFLFHICIHMFNKKTQNIIFIFYCSTLKSKQLFSLKLRNIHSGNKYNLFDTKFCTSKKIIKRNIKFKKIYINWDEKQVYFI